MNLTHHPEPGDHLLLDYLGREALPRAAHEWQQEDVSDGCQLPVQKPPVFSFSRHTEKPLSVHGLSSYTSTTSLTLRSFTFTVSLTSPCWTNTENYYRAERGVSAGRQTADRCPKPHARYFLTTGQWSNTGEPHWLVNLPYTSYHEPQPDVALVAHIIIPYHSGDWSRWIMSLRPVWTTQQNPISKNPMY